MTPSEKTFYEIDRVLSNPNFSKKLNELEYKFFKDCFAISMKKPPYNTLSMKQKQIVFGILKKFREH